jgi:hypothetical protein
MRGCANFAFSFAYLVNVLAVELLKERAEALLVGVNANRAEDRLDVLSRGGGVAGQAEEEVSCHVLHLDGVCRNALVNCHFVAGASVASTCALTVGVVGLKTGESITFKRKRRLNLRVLERWGGGRNLEISKSALKVGRPAPAKASADHFRLRWLP